MTTVSIELQSYKSNTLPLDHCTATTALEKHHQVQQCTLNPTAQRRVTRSTEERVFAILSTATAGHWRTALNCARCWCSCHGDERSTTTRRSLSRSRLRVTLCTPQTISRLVHTATLKISSFNSNSNHPVTRTKAISVTVWKNWPVKQKSNAVVSVCTKIRFLTFTNCTVVTESHNWSLIRSSQNNPPDKMQFLNNQ